MKTITSSVLAFAVGVFAWGGQTGVQPNPKGSTPPAIQEPGVLHPLPVPKQTPDTFPPGVKTPDVRQPVNEGGRERAVSPGESESSKKNGRRTTEKSATKSAKKDGGASAKPKNQTTQP